MPPADATVVGIAWYREQDYDHLLSMFVDAADLPETYSEWLKSAQNTVVVLTLRGITVRKAYLDPVTFPQWCLANDVPMDKEARAN